MKRVFLSTAGLFMLLQSFAQKTTDTSGYEARKLKIEEINLVSSYYSQDGNHASVTGGIGSEKLTDIANVIDIKLTRYDKKLRKHTFGAEIGIDHYTSASSDKIDLMANSSASHADTRIYPSLSWTMENETRGTSIGGGISASTEFDYKSFGGNASFSKKTKDRNGEFTAKAQVYLDQVSLVEPIELRANPNARQHNYPTTPRNSFAISLSYSQIINKRLQVIFLADMIEQQGYLSLPFHRVYFSDSSVHQEHLPGKRLKIPLGLRANYYLGDIFIIKAYYRFYKDDWGIISHTVNLEVPVKITPFLSVSPFYRFYSQSAIDYFAAYRQHTAPDQYYTSNYDVSKFNSNFFGAGIRVAPPKGVFGNPHFIMAEFRYGHYAQTTDLNSNIISMNLKFK